VGRFDDFEYEDNDSEDGGDVDVENKYYGAKGMKTSDPEEAVTEFLGIPALEEQKGDWGFKALKQATKLEFTLGWYDKVCIFCAAVLHLLTFSRQSSIIPNSSHTSRAPSRETSPKSRSIVSWIS